MRVEIGFRALRTGHKETRRPDPGLLKNLGSPGVNTSSDSTRKQRRTIWVTTDGFKNLWRAFIVLIIRNLKRFHKAKLVYGDRRSTSGKISKSKVSPEGSLQKF
jgi:hypothetical protein